MNKSKNLSSQSSLSQASAPVLAPSSPSLSPAQQPLVLMPREGRKEENENQLQTAAKSSKIIHVIANAMKKTTGRRNSKDAKTKWNGSLMRLQGSKYQTLRFNFTWNWNWLQEKLFFHSKFSFQNKYTLRGGRRVGGLRDLRENCTGPLSTR